MGPNKPTRTAAEYKAALDTAIGFCVLLTTALLAMIFVMMTSDAQEVTSREIAVAEQVCNDNGGVQYIDVDLQNNDVRCVNGAHFSDLKYIEIDE